MRAFDDRAWPVAVGPLNADLAAAVADLHSRCFHRPWTTADFRRLLSAEHCRGIGACSGEALAGFILISAAASESEILTLAVDQPFRRQRIACALIEAAFTEAAGMGAQVMLLEVGVANQAAQALYARCGFVPVGRRRDYYVVPDGREDALVMKRRIGHGGPTAV